MYTPKISASILPALFLEFLFLGGVFGVEDEIDCSAKNGSKSCYTCMGRDMVNCFTGQVCCSGSCFKLMDEKHDLIMKGCTNEEQEDGSMKQRILDVKLYWANDENVTGESYFCKNDNYCNGGTVGSLMFIAPILVYITLL